MVKAPIKVFIRVRPDVTSPSEDLHFDENGKCVNLTIPFDDTRGHLNPQPEYWNFKFDQVLVDTSQEETFRIVATDTIKSALEGYSGTIFCYGQTGAGKTYTMSGSSSSYKNRGIIPRTISALFHEISKRINQQINVKISYLEIYNEILLDLLRDGQDSTAFISEDKNGNVVLKGLSQVECADEQEGLNVLFKGEKAKTMSQHNLNKISSRSHSIFTIYIETKTAIGDGSNKVSYSKINLVDLAGSERVKKTGSEGQTLIEANYINKSLSFLEQVVVALSEKQRDHIPYRQSKLTNLLKDSIGGNSKTTMIANIWPETSNLEETISTLKFAVRMKKVSNEPTANIQVGYPSPFKKFGGASNKKENDEPMTPEQQQKQFVLAEKFLQGEIADVEIKSLAQAKDFINHCRNLYQDLLEQTQKYKNRFDDKTPRSRSRKVEPEEYDYYGNEEEDKEDEDEREYSQPSQQHYSRNPPQYTEENDGDDQCYTETSSRPGVIRSRNKYIPQPAQEDPEVARFYSTLSSNPYFSQIITTHGDKK